MTTIAEATGDLKPDDEVKRNDARITFNAFLEHEVEQDKQGGVLHLEGNLLLQLFQAAGVTISTPAEMNDFINKNPELFFVPSDVQCSESWSMDQLWGQYLKHCLYRERQTVQKRCLVAAFRLS